LEDVKIRASKVDVGLTWAKVVNVWGQIGIVAGVVNLSMMIGVFYTTTLEPNLSIPLWLYLGVIVVAATVGVVFVLKIGIAGYYKFFSQQSEVSEVNLRVKILMNHFGIDEKEMLRLMRKEKENSD